jgi:hypothetical protein
LLETKEIGPANESEKQRITSAGEEVGKLHDSGPMRIGGRLAVSRALGDCYFKSTHHNGLYAGKDAAVSPIPMVTHQIKF